MAGRGVNKKQTGEERYVKKLWKSTKSGEKNNSKSRIESDSYVLLVPYISLENQEPTTTEILTEFQMEDAHY